MGSFGRLFGDKSDRKFREMEELLAWPEQLGKLLAANVLESGSRDVLEPLTSGLPSSAASNPDLGREVRFMTAYAAVHGVSQSDVADAFRDRVMKGLITGLRDSGFDLATLGVRVEEFKAEIVRLAQQVDSGHLSIGYVIGMAVAKSSSHADPFLATALAPMFLESFTRAKSTVEELSQRFKARSQEIDARYS